MKKYNSRLALIVIAFFLGGCVYNFVVPEMVNTPEDPTDPDAPQISFITDIEPIFNDGNKCTACHKPGGQAPDLSTGNAYASINNAKYINTGTPEESKIYTVPHPVTGDHPKEYTANEAASVLGWIIQGAKNN